MKKITLDKQEMSQLMRPIVGQGGWQSLLARLQALLDQNTGEITLSDEDRGCLCRYAFDYGNGGWESQLRQIFGKHLKEMR